jgi:hypothetical protein
LGTYGEIGPLFSFGEPFAAEPSLGLVDIRGDELGMVEGTSAGRFLGLGWRGCGEDKGAAADATAVDMIIPMIDISVYLFSSFFLFNFQRETESFRYIYRMVLDLPNIP